MEMKILDKSGQQSLDLECPSDGNIINPTWTEIE